MAEFIRHYIGVAVTAIRIIDAHYYRALKKHYNREFFIMNNAEVWPSGSANVLGDWTAK